MVDVAKLRVLRAVVAKGSLRAAADALDYTPSAVSQQLAALQRETGLRLFDRAGRGVEPTVAGRALAAESESLFGELARMDGLVRDLRAGRTGSLSIGYFASAGATWLPTVVTALLAEFPDLRLDLRWTEVAEDGPGELDVNVFVEHPGSEPLPGALVHPLIDDPYLAVVRDDDPLAALSEIPLGVLSERAWIDNDLSQGACRAVLLSACAEAGFTPRFSVEMRDYRTAIPFVASGIGITVIPRLGIGDLPDGLRAVPVVSPRPVRRISVAVKRSVATHPPVMRTLALLDAAVAAPADRAQPERSSTTGA
ncbi:LysR family transcriptional regulator [Saccharomonospora saliphila]|uniref:LysR family transcriptional regulator n=1 Tax=Saccharomonospora saliphila TaxID=369829 RepID=UPI0003716DA6|nr:LysR family transcriptional regulator [Saccharomonospora saliphila]